MRTTCRVCLGVLRGAEQALGTCINCVHEVRYTKVTIKEPGYNYGQKRPNGGREDRK